MKKFLLLFVMLALLMSSCSSSRKIVSKKSKKVTKADKIVRNAKKYIGTKYIYGGTSKSGMDCSGLVFVAFKSQKFQLPRVSRAMANKGKKISLKRVKKGDLVFFRTNKRRRRINHVGVVSFVNKGTIRFVHATTSRGVIESSLSEKYWRKAFVKATTVL